MPFRINALGPLVVAGPQGPLAGSAVQRRTLAMLAYLAVAGARGVTREKLIGVLWPDSTDDRARHALAQTLYRVRQHFGPDGIVGTDLLRLDSSLFTADVADFENAVARGDLDAARAMYTGPFLDGFALPGAADFERWAEQERARFAALYRQVLERLATTAEREGADARAADRWRELAAADPLNSRVAARLVRALTRSNQRVVALQYARVHETLLRQEVSAQPSGEFLLAVEEARTRELSTPAARPAAPPVAPSSVVEPIAPPTSDLRFQHTAETLRVAIPRRQMRRVVIAVSGLIVLTGAALSARAYARDRSGHPRIAVGHIADLTGDDSGKVGRVVSEMLTTNLSRLSEVTVVNRARLFELMGRATHQPGPADYVRAAQLAGVQQLIDGALYRRPDGTLRIDIRILGLADGAVARVHQAHASDAFAIADSATAQVAGGLGIPMSGALRVADVTTASLVAFGLYEEGMRALGNGDLPSAQRLFAAALSADSSFAMAAFGAYHAHAPGDGNRATVYLERARQLASRATERERLLIEATWAHWVYVPSMVGAAERVANRFPADPESQVLLANTLQWSGDFAGAIVAARRAIAIDSASVRGRAHRCLSCDALSIIALSYVFMDSLGAAERLARDWIAEDDSAAHAWRMLRDIALARDDLATVAAAHQRLQALSPSNRWEDYYVAVNMALRAGEFSKVGSFAAPVLATGTTAEKRLMFWWQAIAERHAGRLGDALRTVERLRRLDSTDVGYMQLQAQVLREMQQDRRAAAILDSAVRLRRRFPVASQRARHVAWAMTQHASALASAGEIGDLLRRADTIEAYGRQSGYGRDPRLHHHVRGLWHAANNRPDEAIREYRKAMWSPTAGFVQTNLELGRLLLARGRALEAIDVLRAGLRAGFESTGLYATKTELRAVITRAHAEAGHADSARVHREWVERALVNADPPVRERIYSVAGVAP